MEDIKAPKHVFEEDVEYKKIDQFIKTRVTISYNNSRLKHSKNNDLENVFNKENKISIIDKKKSEKTIEINSYNLVCVLLYL